MKHAEFLALVASVTILGAAGLVPAFTVAQKPTPIALSRRSIVLASAVALDQNTSRLRETVEGPIQDMSTLEFASVSARQGLNGTSDETTVATPEQLTSTADGLLGTRSNASLNMATTETRTMSLVEQGSNVESAAARGAAEPTPKVWAGADVWHMQCAMHHARSAAAEGEVPVGAVLVAENGTVLARTHNLVRQSFDVTAHAEVVAVREAAAAEGNWRLSNCTL